MALAADTSKSKDAALLDLMERTDYNIVQENGQRKFGPPPDWKGSPPPKGSEVFVGKIPRDLYEDELVPIFERIGKIYEIRLMMDFSGSNRGYAFVMYTNTSDAKKAVRDLDNCEIRKGRFIGVCKSVDNCRLFVGGIPKSKTREEILAEMMKVTEGVVDVILYSSVVDKTKNRGFAFVEYENHRSAAMARRKLIPGKIQLWGHEIAVDWAEPEPEVDEDTMSKVTILYVRNIMTSTTEECLRKVFSLGSSLKVEKVKKLRDFAFVHYRSREDAEMALNRLNGSELEGAYIGVTWAKPVERSTRQRSWNDTNPVINNCTPFVYGQPCFDPFNYNSSVTFPNPAAVMPSSCRGALVSRVFIRGRGRGAAGLRGQGYPGIQGRGTAHMKPYQYYLVDMQPNIELIPTNPYTLKHGRKPSQILLEECQKNNWGDPAFQLHSTVHNDNGEGVQLFMYKVTIPGTGQQYQPTKLCSNIDEARQLAAEHVLIQLGISPDGFGATLPMAGSLGPSPYASTRSLGSVGYLQAGYEHGFFEPLSPALPLF